MRLLLLAVTLGLGCHAPAQGGPDAAPVSPDAPLDRLQVIYDQVDGARITQLVKEMTGVVPVTVGGASITIDERYSDAGRQNFRAYWTQYMRSLGLEVNQLHYQASGHPRAGDNVEAVLPGASADSVIVIVHYDSIGPPGSETTNPGTDDDMTGMSIELETARILTSRRSELAYTVRFVASDEEELGGLAGARDYAAHIKALSQSAGFHLVAAIDDEQSGWNCNAEAACGDNVWPAFDVYSCGSNQSESFDYQALGDRFATIVQTYSPLHVTRGCIGPQSDHFAMWEIGVPTLVYSEHNSFGNDHFDQRGGDIFAKIDTDYLASIARASITFQATLAGLTK